MRKMLHPLLELLCVQLIAGKPLLSKMWIPSLSIGFVWTVLMPVLYSLSAHTVFSWNPRNDILGGTYCMLLLMLLQIGLTVIKAKCANVIYKISAAFFVLLIFASSIIPLTETGYFLLYHVTLSDDAIYAIQGSYPREALGYIQAHIGWWTSGVIAVIFIISIVAIYRFCLKMPSFSRNNVVAGIVILAIPVLAIHLFRAGYLSETMFFSAWKQVSAYRQEQNLFTQDYEQRYQNLQLNTDNPLLKTNPGTVIVVIGESACRNDMKVYNPDFPYDDTPWLSSQKQNKDFFIYQNVYSSWPQTVPSLMRACTEMSQYNDKNFNHAITFVDIAKKAGYQTYWYSNQGGMGQFDAPITLVMKTADHYASPAINDRLHYDKDLLPFLEEVNPDQNNFIVIHLKGSHQPYESRYPKEAAVFDTSTHEGDYANTILYTDTVLQDIFAYAQQNLHLQAMVYFSDHGEDLNRGHGPDIKDFDQVRIPMFIYLSPEYQNQHPEKSALLRQREKSYFTNDMIYNTMSGLLDAPSNHYDAKEDFSSSAYAYNRDNLWTFKHTVKVSEDPYDK